MITPKQHEVAQASQNWMCLSQDFFFAGRCLFEQRKTSAKQFKQSIGTRMEHTDAINSILSGLTRPIIFNLAFSIELAVKGVLVHSDPDKWVPQKGKVRFSHDIYNLMTNEIGINLGTEETTIAKRIRQIVTWGKYPERTNPSTEKEHVDINDYLYHPYVNFPLDEFYNAICSIRDKLNRKYNRISSSQ